MPGFIENPPTRIKFSYFERQKKTKKSKIYKTQIILFIENPQTRIRFLTPIRGGTRNHGRSWIGFWTHLGCQKGAKTEPKTRPGGLKTTQEATKTARKTTKIDQKIVFKNDRVLERS